MTMTIIQRYLSISLRSSYHYCKPSCITSTSTNASLGRGHKQILCFSSSSSASLKEKEEDFFDVTIVGGGVVGSSMANLLRRELPNLRVALIDSKKEPPTRSLPSPSQQRVVVPSPRSYALSPRSLTVLGPTVESSLPIGYYNSMQVWQDSSPASLTFTTKDLDPDPNSKRASYLGGCCEDQTLVETLWDELSSASETSTLSSKNNIVLMSNTSIKSIATVGNVSNNLVSVETNNAMIAIPAKCHREFESRLGAHTQ